MGLFLKEKCCWFRKNKHGKNKTSLRSRQQQRRKQMQTQTQQTQQTQTQQQYRQVAIHRLPFLKRNLSYHRIDIQSKNTSRPKIENWNQNRDNTTNVIISRTRRRRFRTLVMSRYHQHRRNVNCCPTTGSTVYPRHGRDNGVKGMSVLSILEQIDSGTTAHILHPSNDRNSKHFQPCIVPCKKFPPYSPFCQVDDGLVNLANVNVNVNDNVATFDVASGTTANSTTGLHEDMVDNISSLDVMPSSVSVVLKQRKWNPPVSYSTAFGLFSNKVQNEHMISKDNNVPPLKRSQILAKWNELQDYGKFWIMEARWDQLRYKYQKAVYDMARKKVQLGCVIFSYYFYDAAVDDDEEGDDDDDDHEEKAKKKKEKKNDHDHSLHEQQLHVQLEKRMDRLCPFCFYDGRDDMGLLMHCRTVHGEERESRGKITFDAGIDSERNLHIMVKGYCPIRVSKDKVVGEKVQFNQNDNGNDDDYVNFIFTRGYSSSAFCNSSSHYLLDDGMLPYIPFVRLPAKFTTLLDSKTKKKKTKQLEQQIRLGDDRVHPQALSQYITNDVVPIRQYYHSKTMQPMANNGEWDADSDDESDDTWAHRIYECALQDLDDVSPKEKIFMNKWNRFMGSHTIIADHVIPTKCKEFLVKYSTYLVENELRDQFLLHLFNLWDNRLISSSTILELMTLYDTNVKGRVMGESTNNINESTLENRSRKRKGNQGGDGGRISPKQQRTDIPSDISV